VPVATTTFAPPKTRPVVRTGCLTAETAVSARLVTMPRADT
jgi:hypothetical protein